MPQDNHSAQGPESSVPSTLEECQDLFARAPIGIFTSNPEGRILSANPALARMHGYDSPEEMIASITDIAKQYYVDPSDRENVIHLVEKQGQEVNQEFRTYCRDGSIIWTFENTRGVRDKNGKINHYQGFVADITERKRHQKDLEDSQELLELISENMFDMVSLTDLEGNYEFVGRSHQILGYEPDFLLGKNVMDFVHPEDLTCVAQEFKEFLLSRDDGRKVEYRYMRKDGTYVWLETIGRFIKGSVSRPVKIIFNTRDITEHKMAEEALRESEERYRLLFEHSPLGVMHANENGVIKECNSNFVRIIGSSKQILVGLNMFNLPDQKLVAELRKTLQGGIGFYEDVYHSVTASKSTPVRALFAPIRDNKGQLKGCVGIVEDITDQMQTKEDLRQSENYYRAIFETSGTAMFINEGDTTIRHVNSNFETLAGYSRQEIEGKKSWTEFVHADDLDWMMKIHYLRRHAPEAAPRQYEFRFINRYGEALNVLLAVDMISGTYQSVVSVIDITERKQAYEKLQQRKSELEEQKSLYSSLVEDHPYFVERFLPDTTITFANNALADNMGYRPEQLKDKKMDRVCAL